MRIEPATAANPPLVLRPELTPFDPANLDSVARAFQGAPVCPLRQAWRAEPEPNFQPAIVRTGWRGRALFVFAELTGARATTSASRSNERLWELGDVLEIFLRPDGQTAYSEFQIAPNNLQLQLRYAGVETLAQARRTNSIAAALVQKINFKSHAWTRLDAGCWHVLAEIPAETVLDVPGPLPGTAWHFSFCRYDYTRGPQPVISASAPLSRPDFHRQQEWGILRFQA
jgi:hypothetical protein